MEPIFSRETVRTASRLPEFISEGRDVIMAECGDAVSSCGRLMVRMHAVQVFASLP